MYIKISDVQGQYYQIYIDVGVGDWSFYDNCYSTEELALRIQDIIEEGGKRIWH